MTSRLLVHSRWVTDQNTRAGQDVLRAAIQRRGLPEQLHVDNGAPFSNAALERSCAVLGIRLIHSRPYRPQGRGKQERLGRYIRERFLLEAEAQGIASFSSSTIASLAWAEQVCNTRVHAETDQTPIERFTSHGPLHAVEPSLLREAFRWSVMRRVTTTASVSLTGNRYAVDQSLIGRRVELRFDPEDLTRLDVFWEGHPAARPFRSSSVATCIARCRKLCHPHHHPQPASITSAWCWPTMTPKRWASSPSATCPATRTTTATTRSLTLIRFLRITSQRRTISHDARTLGHTLWLHQTRSLRPSRPGPA